MGGGESGTPKSYKIGDPDDDHKFMVLIAEDNRTNQQAL